MKGVKYDKEKPMADLLLDFDLALEDIARLLTFGAHKYERHNWKRVENGFERYTAAMLRHLLQEQREPLDKESGVFHATAVACNALMRLQILLEELYNENNSKPVDDYCK